MENELTRSATQGQIPEIIFLEADRDYLLRANEIVRYPGAQRIPDGFLTVRGGRIEAVQAGGASIFPRFQGPGWRRLHLGDVVLFPALTDSHLHLGIGPARNPGEGLRRCLLSGIGSVRDGGDGQGRTLTNKGELLRIGVRVRACGWAIRAPGGYGGFLGKAVADLHGFDRLLEALVTAGADFVKVIASGIVDFRTGGVTEPCLFDESDLRHMVARARDRGFEVMAHANSDQAVQRAVRAGARSIEHGYLIHPDTLKMVADAGVYWTPTLLPVHRLGVSAAFHTKEPPHAVENLHRIYGQQEENVALAPEIGVKVVAGTDAGAPGIVPGASLHEELRLLVRAGLPVETALEAATVRAEEMMASLSGVEAGSLDRGLRAHILALDPACLGRLFGPEDIRGVMAVRGADDGRTEVQPADRGVAGIVPTERQGASQ